MRTNAEKEMLTNEKKNSLNIKDKIVMDELLKMGFSYAFIGTHYLHDSVVFALSGSLESCMSVREFCGNVAMKVCEKYNIKSSHYRPVIATTIEWAFDNGNINYILETFKEAYNHERMTVTGNQFIMVLRNKILNEMKEQQPYSDTQLRVIIQGTIEKITDYALLKGICDIVLSLGSGVVA